MYSYHTTIHVSLQTLHGVRSALIPDRPDVYIPFHTSKIQRDLWDDTQAVNTPTAPEMVACGQLGTF
jgi:hypothetical protein